MTGISGVALDRYFGISEAGATSRHGIIAEKIKKTANLVGRSIESERQ